MVLLQILFVFVIIIGVIQSSAVLQNNGTNSNSTNNHNDGSTNDKKKVCTILTVSVFVLLRILLRWGPGRFVRVGMAELYWRRTIGQLFQLSSECRCWG